MLFFIRSKNVNVWNLSFIWWLTTVNMVHYNVVKKFKWKNLKWDHDVDSVSDFFDDSLPEVSWEPDFRALWERGRSIFIIIRGTLWLHEKFCVSPPRQKREVPGFSNNRRWWLIREFCDIWSVKTLQLTVIISAVGQTVWRIFFSVTRPLNTHA